MYWDRYGPANFVFACNSFLECVIDKSKRVDIIIVYNKLMYELVPYSLIILEVKFVTHFICHLKAILGYEQIIKQ